MKNYICIDIGGTTIKHGVVDESLTVLIREEMPTESLKTGGPGIVEKVFGIVEKWQKNYAVLGVAISTAGMVDPETGCVFHSGPMIPNYTGTALKALVEDKTGLPCFVENDVNCAGLAESTVGAGRGTQSCLCLTVGTGIGGCLVIDGQIFHGFSNAAFEVGYITVKGGSFQGQAATSVLVKKIAEARGITPDQIDGKQIFAEAKGGVTDCVLAIDELVDALAEGIANIVYVVNPQIVVLGGGVMAQQDYLKPRIEAALKAKIIPTVYNNTHLAFAQRGNDAGMVGALINFLNRSKKA